MSIDIDWSLLSSVTSGDSLSNALVAALNKQLESAKRPSFLGPITVTEFDFGTVGPEVEIKDVGDVWHAFQDDDNEDEDDDNNDHRGEEEHGEDVPDVILEETFDDGGYGDGDDPRRFERGRRRSSFLGAEGWEYPIPNNSRSSRPKHYAPSIHGSETGSVLSEILSPRVSLNRMGVGIGIGSGMGVNLAGTSTGGGGYYSGMMSPALAPSIFSQSLSHSARGGKKQNIVGRPTGNQHLRYLTNQHLQAARGVQTRSGSIMRSHSREHVHTHTNTHHTHTPTMTVYADTLADPPMDPPQENPLPSLQLALHISHTPNIHLTLLTTLQINYPSKLFMTLPLKLSITGFSLNADVVVAFNGPKRRIHLSIIDEFDPHLPSPSLTASHSVAASPSTETISIPSTPGGLSTHIPLRPLMPMNNSTSNTVPPASPMNRVPMQPPTLNPYQPIYPSEPKPIGQRLLPSLQIESEIGHSDVHVLRNVGKVEKFILDVVRKTLVDELVFPNYHTVAM